MAFLGSGFEENQDVKNDELLVFFDVRLADLRFFGFLFHGVRKSFVLVSMLFVLLLSLSKVDGFLATLDRGFEEDQVGNVSLGNELDR